MSESPFSFRVASFWAGLTYLSITTKNRSQVKLEKLSVGFCGCKNNAMHTVSDLHMRAFKRKITVV